MARGDYEDDNIENEIENIRIEEELEIENKNSSEIENAECEIEETKTDINNIKKDEIIEESNVEVNEEEQEDGVTEDVINIKQEEDEECQLEKVSQEVVSENKRRCKKVLWDATDKKREITNITIRKFEYKAKKFKKIIEIDKVCETAKKVADSKTTKKVLNVSVAACSCAFALNFIDTVTRKVVLEVNAQEVSWVMSKDLDSTSYEYELFRNGERMLTTKACKFIESIGVDTEAPDKVSSIRLNKTDDNFTFTWKAPEDNGVEFEYKVKAINKGFGKAYTSKTLNADVVSGIEKYIVMIDDKRYETVVPSFSININSLKCGSHTLEVIAVDCAGNMSKSKKLEFKVDNTKFFIADYKLATNNTAINNDDYDIYLVKENEVEKDGKVTIEKTKTPIALGDYISTYFMNAEVPMIANPRYLYQDDMLNITWEENTFGTNNTEFYIECKSKKGIKSYKSEKMNYSSGDFLPGYYYQINKDPLYTVNKTDSYTMDNNVTLDYNRFNAENKYYFHVAASNEYGNLSKTKTLEIDLKNFTSVGEKKDAVRDILYRTKGLESDIFRKITDDLYNIFTLSTIEKLKELNLKIVVTQEDVTSYVSSNHNAKVTDKNICYIKDDLTIVYNAKSSLDLLVKEVVKVLDDAKSNPVSKNIDYLNIYNAEKTTLGDGNLSAQDYLAEAVNLYIEDSHLLKSTSPNTYEFIKLKYKTIMFA